MVRQGLFSRVRACTHAILGERAARACTHAPYNFSSLLLLLVALLALVSVALGQPSQPLPWTERFQGPGLDPAWQTHVSAAIESIPEERFQQRLDETAAFWKSLLAKGMRVHVPEPRVNDAYRAWLAYNFLNVDKRGNLYEPHDGGGGFYEAIFGYSAALYCHALDLAGYPDEARTYLDSLLALVTPEGRFEVNFGLPDGGTLLFAAGEHYRLGGDAAWLRRAAPTLVKMCRWIAVERTKALAGQPADSPVRGLIKGKPYCDEAEHACSYLTDCYFVLGMSVFLDGVDHARSGEGTILAFVDPPARIPPEAIALRLRHPRGDSIRSVRVDGRPSTDFTADTVTLRGLTARAAIEVRYRP